MMFVPLGCISISFRGVSECPGRRVDVTWKQHGHFVTEGFSIDNILTFSVILDRHPPLHDDKPESWTSHNGNALRSI